MTSSHVEEGFERAIDKKSHLKYYVKMELLDGPPLSPNNSRYAIGFNYLLTMLRYDANIEIMDAPIFLLRNSSVGRSAGRTSRSPKYRKSTYNQSYKSRSRERIHTRNSPMLNLKHLSTHKSRSRGRKTNTYNSVYEFEVCPKILESESKYRENISFKSARNKNKAKSYALKQSFLTVKPQRSPKNRCSTTRVHTLREHSLTKSQENHIQVENEELR